MRKAVTDGAKPTKGDTRRRYWVHATPGGNRKAEGEPKRPAKARFLEPYHISEARRGELIELLAASSVGDAESRDLFVAAIEYDIANLRRSAPAATPAPAEPAPEAAPQSVPDPAPDLPSGDAVTPVVEAQAPPAAVETTPVVGPLAEIMATARLLAARLEDLEPEPRLRIATALQDADPFRRVHTADYFRALECELARLALAISGIRLSEGEGPVPTRDADPLLLHAREAIAPQAQPVPTPPPVPPLNRASRRFLDRVARVYEEVLEAPAELGVATPFAALLRLVAGEAGIPLPADPAALAAAWRPPEEVG
jgi:hypothetical protein